MDEICDYEEYTMHCNECIDNNPLLKFFFLASFIPFTMLFSMWVVAKFVYKPDIDAIEDIEEEEEEEELYEDKYPIEENLNQEKDININNFVLDYTPNGNVFMRYNKENEDFEYWCDDKQIPYKYLETVSRKFVNNFGCQDLYIDRKREIELQKAKKTEKKAPESEKEEIEEEKDSVFAKFKPKVETKAKIKNVDVDVAIRGNKYKYMDKIKNFSFIPDRKKEINVKKMSFSDWKAQSSWF